MPKKSNLVATVCAWCGAEFIDHGSNHRKYCSHACYSKGRKKQPDTACQTCGMLFVSRGSRPNPYCSRACSAKAKERKDERSCPNCGKTFMVRDHRNDRYCSVKCAQQHRPKRGKATYGECVCTICGITFTKTRRESSGLYCSKRCSWKGNGINQRQRITKNCEMCGKSFEVYPSTAHVRQCSMACEAKRKRGKNVGPDNPLWKGRIKKNCEVCGKECSVRPCVAERFRACSKRCAGVLSKISQPTISSIERIMADRFAAAGLSPKQQFQIAYYVVDFAFPDARLVVEVDGDYWHSLPKVQRVDKSKNTYLSRHGWRLVRLAESDIKRDPDACVKRVKAALRVPSEQMMLMPV